MTGQAWRLPLGKSLVMSCKIQKKILSVLINHVNSCNVCVFYFCIFSNQPDLFEETCVIEQLQQKSFVISAQVPML